MNYGFIGLGNMASALIKGIRESAPFKSAGLFGYDIDPARANATGIPACESMERLVSLCDVVILAVKPQNLEAVLGELAPMLCPGKLLVSIAAGKPVAFYEKYCAEIPFVRVMPNINALALASATAVCGGSYATEEHVRVVRELFSCVGSVYELPERLFPAFSAIAGAAPAFAYMFTDALAGAGVKHGIPKQLALKIAADTVLGSAKLIAGSDVHPQELVDRVCSPGGTTIEGVHALRHLSFENAVYEAVDAVVEKDKKIGG